MNIMRMEEMRSGVKLSSNPKDLYTIWKEWELGLKWTKPASDFTIHERGVNISWHKNLWGAVIHMIAHGFTSDTVIDRIYLVYGCGEVDVYHLLQIG